jgi:glycosyltransferase involved in cell wall biosynthesis
LNKLFLYTASYPYGKGETFIEHDLSVISKNYDKVYIIPFNKTGDRRSIPFDNIEVLELPEEVNPSISMLKVLKAKSTGITGIGHFRENRAYLKNVFKFRKAVKELLGSNQKADHFSFWMNEWAILLSELKREIDFSFVCRGHGYDVFSERHKKSYISFQSQIINQAQKIILSSEFSRKYLVDKFPAQKNKFTTVHLNPPNQSGQNKAPKNELHFVSVSNLVDVKQVHLIPELLSKVKCDYGIKWTHIGEGPAKEKVKESIKKLDSSIQCDLRGHLDNQKIIEFYQTEEISAFIHASASEGGVPLAIKEAFMFGLPLMALPNGGVGEAMDAHPFCFDMKDYIPWNELNNFNRDEIQEAYAKHFSRASSQAKLISVLEEKL